MIKPGALFACALALVSSHGLADDGGVSTPASPKALATKGDKQRAIEAASRPSSGSPSGGESLGNRGSPTAGKKWDEMTPAEQDAAHGRWLLNSGDFKGRGRGLNNSAPATKDRGAVILSPDYGPNNNLNRTK